MFAISISSLFFYHLYLTAKNRTTLGKNKKKRSENDRLFVCLESFRSPIFANGPEKNGFNLGWKRNYQEIFGENLLRGLIPISTT